MALNAEASTGRWLPSHVYASLEETSARLGDLISCDSSPGDPRLGAYVLAVEDLELGRLLGHVGFSPLDVDVEVSYAIAEAFRGRGLGAEALASACSWIAETWGVPRVLAVTASANAASRRVLDRAGFVLEGERVMLFQGGEAVVSRYFWHATGVGRIA